MDQRTKVLIEQIAEDSINEHFRNLGIRMAALEVEMLHARVAQRKEEEERIAILPPENRWHLSDIKGYSSDRWVYLAGEYFRPCAIAIIEELGGKIREVSTSSGAGEMFEAAVAEMMRRLDAAYEDEFNGERPFLWNGRDIPLPPYWANLRSDLERKIRIEELKFGSESDVAVLVPNATAAQKRDKPFADKAAQHIREGSARDVAKAIRLVRPEREMVKPDSVERAIRSCFDLHYDNEGRPLSK